MKRIAGSFLAAVIAAPLPFAQQAAWAQAVTPSAGTYEQADSGYSIEVVPEGDAVVVVEPNKRSRYTRVGDREYTFYNDNTGSTFRLRVIDNQTLEAFRYPLRGAPIRLARVGGPPPPTGKTDLEAPGAARSDVYGALAQTYRERSIKDPDNAQSWTFCAAAALKRSHATAAEADAYAVKAAQSLKIIAVDPTRTPCEDAIPAALWARAPGPDDSAVPELPVSLPPVPVATAPAEPIDEEADRARINAAIAAETQARVQKESDDFARKQAEYVAAQNRYAQAQDKYHQDQATYQEGVAKAQADAEAYRKQMEAYRAELASGKYAPAK